MKSKSLDDEADSLLVHRFAEGRDERAFTKLVKRHGALVAGVCARLLRNRDAAEDAFQAVFLVLARRANALRRRGSLAGWLHHVAVHVCLNERRAGRRRQRQLQEAAKLVRENTPRGEQMGELKRVIDEELAGLPERLRDVLILCDLEGHTQADAARRLSLTVRTVSIRLRRGREAMRKRLARHGLPIAAGGVASALATCGQTAPTVSAELISTTVRNAHGAARTGVTFRVVADAELPSSPVDLPRGSPQLPKPVIASTGVCNVNKISRRAKAPTGSVAEQETTSCVALLAIGIETRSQRSNRLCCG